MLVTMVLGRLLTATVNFETGDNKNEAARLIIRSILRQKDEIHSNSFARSRLGTNLPDDEV